MARADFQVVIGLEVHAQMLTQTKLFSAASASFGSAPNVNIQPLCLGMPGTLPVLNSRVVEFAIRTGLALECTVNERSEWSRKHYFYPDLPKGYQITQYEFPICSMGRLQIATEAGPKFVTIRRIHIEEDAGKLVHEGGRSLVDLNRAGTPLLEIVSDPDLRSADEAVEYLKALREILVYIGVSDGNLEEGSFRCDANVSVMRHGSSAFGTRCELKNLNSFRFIKQAIEIEASRHVEVIESGGVIEQETRLFDPARGETRAMRSKEDAHDYRYFPDPDLPPLLLTKAQLDAERAQLPELPRAKRERLVKVLGLPEYDAGVLTADRAMAELFDACVRASGDAKKVSNWFMGELSRYLNETKRSISDAKFTPAQFGDLMKRLEAGSLSSNQAREVFAAMFETGKAPADIVKERGLEQVTDTGALEAAVDAALAANESSVAAYKAGKTQVLSFLMGAVMKSLKGKGNAKVINELLLKKLSS